ncbi:MULTISPECIES: NUDIX domain-containing protein [unclassified Caballeronia]|uniref:NUDIX domain-containing protein n=1 Tax=unclassified Caballeronia TaxID=2646786 RepID=UPI002865B767|nr:MULTISPECIES: NUDIX domain-containing protein [unclassified Caballeronia]MDR5777739.1 NUDIX domain-containing protein [Caballeronia sp. LZ002]MDR5798506.1 NUDIX domain-containing protein [Caballeronia sp. LZ001]MDR5804977.1 NUDIX domain-containing protein [Caballeronia sp. LZ001]MDR5853169.1 NUDIX domain-containing protein [Caballeronia sp. LZ003]
MTIERERPYLAIYCIVRNGNHVLMLRRANTGYADGKWSFPAGHVDEKESLTTAASRELKEETGLSVLETDWIFHSMMHRRTADRRVIDVFMEATNWQGQPVNTEPHKCSAIRFMSPMGPDIDLMDYIVPVFLSLAGDGTEPYLEWGWSTHND